MARDCGGERLEGFRREVRRGGGTARKRPVRGLTGPVEHSPCCKTPALQPPLAPPPPWAALIGRIADFAFQISAIALAVASAVLTGGVIAAHILGRGIAWQDEVEIFLVGGAVFLSSAAVQARRGHIGIEFLGALLPARWRGRRDRFYRYALAGLRRFHRLQVGSAAAGGLDRGAGVAVGLGAASLDSVWPDDGGSCAARLAARGSGRRKIPLGVARNPSGYGRSALAPRPAAPLVAGFSPATMGIAYCAATLAFMLSGMPVAFALGSVAVVFMLLFMPRASVGTIAQNVYEELANVIILAIPLFILKGAAIGRSDAGRDLYTALHAWLHRIPGGLGIANTARVRALRGDGGIVARNLLGHRLGRHPRDAQARLFGRSRLRRSSRPAERSESCCRRRSRCCFTRSPPKFRSASCSWRASDRACFWSRCFRRYAAWRYRIRTKGALDGGRRAGKRRSAILDTQNYTLQGKAWPPGLGDALCDASSPAS